MPAIDMSLEQLQEYKGSMPAPVDFWKHWMSVTSKIDAMQLSYRLVEKRIYESHCVYYGFYYQGMDGQEHQAKYIRPATEEKVPLVLQFPDYNGVSRSWFHLMRYAGIGCAVLAPDYALSNYEGLSGTIEELPVHQIYTEALLLLRIVSVMNNIDQASIHVYGEGQGAATALVVGAMNPKIVKTCAMQYPMCCDYKRVWEKDYDTGAYQGLRDYFRYQDPEHKTEQALFEQLGYLDAKNFAPYVKAHVLQGIGLLDEISPPSAQFSIYNNLSCWKQKAIFPKHGHELNNFFENTYLEFLLTFGIDK
ncbi:MAG: acetylxylan esterase [Lachnospiraceae bacterium]